MDDRPPSSGDRRLPVVPPLGERSPMHVFRNVFRNQNFAYLLGLLTGVPLKPPQNLLFLHPKCTKFSGVNNALATSSDLQAVTRKG